MAVFHSELNPAALAFWLCISLQFFLQDWHCALRCFTMHMLAVLTSQGDKKLAPVGDKGSSICLIDVSKMFASCFYLSHIVDPRVT